MEGNREAGRPVRILFWGTPWFALPSLRALGEEGYDIVGVVTQPDRPAGRGRRLTPSPVKEEAERMGYAVFQPERPREAGFIEELRPLRPDLSVVVAYGHILSPEILELPALGSINVHASLLPHYRGAAPINWAIIRGETVTGVTIMRMAEKMDAGDILLQVEEEIFPEDTAAGLYHRLSGAGAGALLATLALLETGGVEEREQEHDQATFAPKLDRWTCRINWNRTAEEIGNWVRGTDDVPGSWSELEGEAVKLFIPRPLPDHPHDREPGVVLATDPEEGVLVAAGRGAVGFLEVQPPGKRRMEAAEWIRGRGVREGQRFE